MTRSRSILVLLATMFIVTSSRDISARIQSDNTTCLLEMDGTDVLQELLKGDAVFINVKLLSFVDASDSVGKSFYKNTTVIDVNHWVVAVGEIGELLLTFPFDFEFLSLGTLSPSVEHISLNVTSIPECFFEVDNEDKLNVIANSLLQLESDKDAKQEVCIERQLDSFNVWDLSLASAAYYSILQISTYFECWQISEDGSIELSKFMKHSYTIFNWLIYIFPLYFIWFIVSFLCHVKPMNETGKEYLSLRTDLPMGPKYFLLHSGNQNNCIFILRWLILWALVGLLQFVPYIIANVSDSDSFYRRRAALKNIEGIPECKPDNTFCQGNIFNNLMYILACIVLLITCLTRQVWFETDFMNNYSNLPVRRIETVRLFLHIFKLPKNNYSGLYKLSFEMKENIKLIVSSSHWKDGLNWFRKYFKINNIGIHVTMFFILVVPFLIFYGMHTILMSLPITYLTMRLCLLPFVNIENITVKKTVVMVVVWMPCGAIMVVVLSTKVGLAIRYILNIIWYFYIGLLVNPGTAGIVAAISLIIIGYVISIITDYYKGYVVLLQQVISAFDELIKDNKVHVSGDKLPSFPQFINEDVDEEHEGDDEDIWTTVKTMSRDTWTKIKTMPRDIWTKIKTMPRDIWTKVKKIVRTNDDGERYDLAAQDSTPSLPIIRQDTDGLTAIEKTLFDTIVTKYRPPETQLLIIIIKLVILSLVIWVSLSTLKAIADFDDLKQVNLYVAVFIAGIVPLFEVILRNKAEEESKKRILEKCIRQDIKEYLAVRERTTQTTAV
ncbi:uncharacterized protein [Antedon mediterranea]|uniref:uncharacterized protein n=1 Tax=Antedon mediterranea TaxID=105859 RepID=UPI003AF76604